MKKRTTIVFLLISAAAMLIACGPKKKADTKEEAPKELKEEVPVELFVMSKCPYGVQAVQGFKPAVDSFKGQVGLHIEYVGQKSPDGKITSMHGEQEVQGNINQVCANAVGDTEQYWKYMDCVNEKWREIPKNWESCVASAGLDKEKFVACKDGEQGKELLGASVDKANSKNAKGSPTIFIGGEPYKGARSAQAIEHYICNKWGDEKKLEYCKDMPAPPEINLFAITDKRCGPKCNPEGMINNLKSRFFGLKPTVLEWSDDKAQEIAKATDTTKLPAYIFDKSVKTDEEAFKQMERWLVPQGDYFVLRAGRPAFDPTAEICDNGKDDTGNGKVDCDDETCVNTLACREKTEKQLEVFVMSQCPFGAMAANAMGEVLDAFKKDIDFKMHFVGNIVGDKVTSMHGQPEVDENMRWACAAKHYPRNNDYMKYVWCRAEDYKNPDWEKCATGPIKKAVIEKCVSSGEGLELLKESVALANGLDISASPTWVVNGTTKFSGVTPKVIQQNYCKANPGLAGCDKELSDDRPTKAGSCGG